MHRARQSTRHGQTNGARPIEKAGGAQSAACIFTKPYARVCVCFDIIEPLQPTNARTCVNLCLAPFFHFRFPSSSSFCCLYITLRQSNDSLKSTSTSPRLATTTPKRVGMFTIRVFSLGLGLGLLRTCAGLSTGSFTWPNSTQQCVVGH